MDLNSNMRKNNVIKYETFLLWKIQTDFEERSNFESIVTSSRYKSHLFVENKNNKQNI